MKNFISEQKGITMVALVITIIIMLILTAATIKIVLDSRLINQAESTKERTEIEALKERLQEKITVSVDFNTGKIDKQKLIDGINQIDGITTDATIDSEFPWTAKIKDNFYIINENGSTEKIKLASDYDGILVFTYNGTSKTASVRPASTEISGEINIPQKVIKNEKIYNITTIGAFQGCTKITKIIIPEGVVGLNSYIFSRCTGLEEATIPSTLTAIPAQIFDGCTNLKKINGEFNITNVTPYAFRNCSSLEEITFTNSLTAIGVSDFNGCTSLKKVNVPDSTLTFDGSSFQNCSNLETITGKLNIIGTGGGGIFSCCSKLKNADITINSKALYNADFNGCSSLTSITLGDNLESLGQYAFCGCTELEITLPKSLKTIGWQAFYKCNKFKELTIPSSVTIIGPQAFQCCSNLEKVTISEGTQTLGQYAFHSCTNLKEVNLPSTITSIGYGAFVYCTNLQNVNIKKEKDSITGSKWGAGNATSINWESSNA